MDNSGYRALERKHKKNSLVVVWFDGDGGDDDVRAPSLWSCAPVQMWPTLSSLGSKGSACGSFAESGVEVEWGRSPSAGSFFCIPLTVLFVRHAREYYACTVSVMYSSLRRRECCDFFSQRYVCGKKKKKKKKEQKGKEKKNIVDKKIEIDCRSGYLVV